MMGHINNLLVTMVRENLGDDGVTNLFAAAGFDERHYQPELIYPEEEFQALFRGAQQVFGVDSDSAQSAFSEYFMVMSPRMFPAIFKQAGSARGLLEMIPTIHRSFPSAASQGKYQQKVSIAESSDDRLIIDYDSPNQLCSVLKRVAELVLDYYGEEGDVHEVACQKEGAGKCCVVVEFNGKRDE